MNDDLPRWFVWYLFVAVGFAVAVIVFFFVTLALHFLGVDVVPQ